MKEKLQIMKTLSIFISFLSISFHTIYSSEVGISFLFLVSGCFTPIVSIEDRFMKFFFFSGDFRLHKISV